MHNGLLQMGDEKMSKSLGNLITIREALKNTVLDGLRLFILSSYYRNPLTYSEEAIEAAERGAERLRQTLVEKGKATGGKLDSASYRQRFIEFMDDDFSTPQAIAVLFELAREINRGNDEGKNTTEACATLRELAGVLGLTLKEPEKSGGGDEAVINQLIATRKQLRDTRQFKAADEVRDKLLSMGIVLEDTPQGTIWKRKK